jgi:hypothetical protein
MGCVSILTHPIFRYFVTFYPNPTTQTILHACSEKALAGYFGSRYIRKRIQCQFYIRHIITQVLFGKTFVAFVFACSHSPCLSYTSCRQRMVISVGNNLLPTILHACSEKVRFRLSHS